MFSVIIPTYNGGKFLKNYSLPSLMKQTYTDWEAIVIDDGSTDNTNQIIRNFVEQDARIRLYSHSINLGLAAALNLGISHAKGDTISILEHDDIWMPDKLQHDDEFFSSGKQISICAAIVYNTLSKRFVKMHLSNLSCISFRNEISGLLFPLPEENKKYLGVEDFVIYAKIDSAKATGLIKSDQINYSNTILTIINSGEKTLSGKRNSKSTTARYYAVLTYLSENYKYPELNKSLRKWRKHHLFNKVLTYFPSFLNRFLYYVADKHKEFYADRAIRFFKETNAKLFEILNEYRHRFGD